MRLIPGCAIESERSGQVLGLGTKNWNSGMKMTRFRGHLILARGISLLDSNWEAAFLRGDNHAYRSKPE